MISSTRRGPSVSLSAAACDVHHDALRGGRRGGEQQSSRGSSTHAEIASTQIGPAWSSLHRGFRGCPSVRVCSYSIQELHTLQWSDSGGPRALYFSLSNTVPETPSFPPPPNRSPPAWRLAPSGPRRAPGSIPAPRRGPSRPPRPRRAGASLSSGGAASRGRDASRRSLCARARGKQFRGGGGGLRCIFLPSRGHMARSRSGSTRRSTAAAAARLTAAVLLRAAAGAGVSAALLAAHPPLSAPPCAFSHPAAAHHHQTTNSIT